MDGCSSSEFGSEDEETEYSLYAKLYFEPNEDMSVGLPDCHLGNLISTPDETEREVRALNKTTASKIPQKNITSLHSSVSEKVAIKSRNGIDSCIEATINKSKSSFVDNTVALPTKKVIKTTKTKARKKQNVKRRERHSSVCSIDSIPGSVALDNLYCHSLDSFDEEEEEETLTNGLIVKPVLDTLSISNKRSKKRKKETCTSELSELEDSRCRKFENISSGQNKKDFKKRTFVSPIICISSTSDSDHEKGKSSKKTVHESMNLDDTKLNGKSKQKKKKRKFEEKVYDISLDSSSNLSHPVQNTQTVDCVINDKTSEKSSITNNSKVSISFVNNTPSVLEIKDFNPKIRFKKPKQSFTDSENESSDCEFLDRQELHKTKLAMNFSDDVTACKPKCDSSFKSNVNITLRQSLTEQLPTFSKFSLDYTKRRPPSKKTPSCKHWTRDMVSFYDSDISEDFDVEDIHSQQSNRGWEIDKTDYHIFFRGRYYNGREDRCKLCRQFGHRMELCEKVPRCHICSATDHTYVRDCPSFCCLWCGGPPHRYYECKSSSAYCQICGIKGHSNDRCPDLWRRFHITASGTIPVRPASPPGVDKRVYCYICAKAGHYGPNCPWKLTSEIKLRYPLQSQEIYSYCEPVVNIDGSLMINQEYLQGNKKTAGSFTNSVPDTRTNSQDPKRSRLLIHLLKCKKKLEVMKLVKERLRYFSKLKNRLRNLPAAVEVLREGKKYLLTTGIPSLEFSLRLEKSLQQVAQVVLGYLRRGEGSSILGHVQRLLSRVEKLRQKDSVPYFMLEEFAQTFGKIYNPPLGKLDEILQLAETYLQSSGMYLEPVPDEQACFKNMELKGVDQLKTICIGNKPEDNLSDISVIDLTASDMRSSKTAGNSRLKNTKAEMKENKACNGSAKNVYLTAENSNELDKICNHIKALKSSNTSQTKAIKNEVNRKKKVLPSMIGEEMSLKSSKTSQIKATKKGVNRKKKILPLMTGEEVSLKSSKTSQTKVTKKGVNRKKKVLPLMTGEEVSNKKSKIMKKKKLRANGMECNVKEVVEIKDTQLKEDDCVGSKIPVMVNDSETNTKKAKVRKKKKSTKSDASLVVKSKNKQLKKKSSPLKKKSHVSCKVKDITSTVTELNGTINYSDAKRKKSKKINKMCIGI